MSCVQHQGALFRLEDEMPSPSTLMNEAVLAGTQLLAVCIMLRVRREVHI